MRNFASIAITIYAAIGARDVRRQWRICPRSMLILLIVSAAPPRAQRSILRQSNADGRGIIIALVIGFVIAVIILIFVIPH